MAATYQSNLKKIQKIISNPNPALWHFDPRAYPNHEQTFVHNSLWHGFDPWKDLYASPLTHINLYQVTIGHQICTLPSLLVRDGLFTLIDFFNRCPKPKDVPGIMLIHKCLRNYVPDNWRSKVLFYEFEYRGHLNSPFHTKNSNVLIKANVTDGMFDYEHAKKKIVELKKEKFEKFVFFFFNRTNPFLVKDWDNDYRANDYVHSQSNFLEFLEKEQIDAEFLTWKEYFHIQGTHQFKCIDLNYKEKYYIDDFTNYHFLKKGATPAIMDEQRGDKSDIYVPLSHFHGIRVLGREPEYNTKKIDVILKNLKLLNIGHNKCDTGAFQIINEISEKKLESSWIKIFN